MNLNYIYEKLKKPTYTISSETLQEIVTTFKTPNAVEEEELINNILIEIWNHLMRGLENFDNQLLCSTCFFSVLCKSNSNQMYLTKMENLITLQIKDKAREKQYQTVSLIYGMFQSAYFHNKPLLLQNIDTLSTLLQAAVDLLLNIAYEYSQYTFVTFKIMTAFKKVIGTSVENIIYSKENMIRLLGMINNNWENPITGVRNLNRTVFKNILLVLDKQMYDDLLRDINNIYWNKAKFLMLAEVVEHYDRDIITLIGENNWVEGVLGSLYKPGLVSAGSDMYFAILKKLNNDDDWISMFAIGIKNILRGNNLKAIENFNNYWCLATLKKFPTLATYLISEVEDTESSDTILYSYLSIEKHTVKLGIAKKDWNLSNHISKGDPALESLKHYKPCIRMIAFEVLCVIEKSLPNVKQYENVLHFLWANVNSDCTVLRLCMLNNVGTFLSKLHVMFLHNNNTNGNTVTQLQSFCEDLQMFIIKSLNYDGNYQRKITTVQLTHLILKNFKNIHQKNKDVRKSNMSLMDFLQKQGVWYLHEKDFLMKLINLLKDSASDIHENVAQILITHYIDDVSDTTTLNNLIDDAIVCINSKLFYEISCGQIIFKLIANILLNKQLETKLKSIEDIFNFAFKVLEKEHSTQNIVASIENGKQLHAYINIIYVILQACRQTSYRIKVPDSTMQILVDILQCVSNQFAWEKESKSSDFSRMNDMVQSLITTSGYDYRNTHDETKISDQYQLVLNCLWLNVKASCDLSSLLIQYLDDVVVCDKCLYTITNVLETSRHKGAIEAAGVAIGNSIRYLTGLPKDNELSALPTALLKKKLSELISETSNTSSITRRGAGLSIMVHRIVSNDNTKGKPLFHYFMNVLLSTCNSNLANEKQNINTEDLPKAVYIHFLTRIVMDSSLASDTMYYATELGEIAFQNLSDEHWQIRNAALQLYGALIPKLIGQKKSCGTDEETVITVACDEFRTHFPTLWMYILQRVETQANSDILQSHSNLVPILNILANMGKRYSFSADKNQNDCNILSNYLLKLLGSPIYVVRRLTSKAIANISTPQILEQIKVNQHFTDNFRHGLLLLVTEFKNYNSQIKNLDDLKRLLEPSNSFLCKLYYDKLFDNNTYDTVDTVNYILNEIPSKKYAPGFSLWMNKTIEKYIENTTWNNIPDLFKTLENNNEFASFCNILLKRLKNTCVNVPQEVITRLTKNLLHSTKQHSVTAVWELLYHMSIKFDSHQHIDINILMPHLQSDNLYSIRYIVPLAARICVKIGDMNNLLQLNSIINRLSNPETSDVDMRYISAKANNEIALEFYDLSDDIKITSIKTAITLLQDEDDDIRLLSSHFYSNIKKYKNVLNPFICVYKIMNKDFLQQAFNNPTESIVKVCQDVSNLVQYSTNESNKFNPFASDSKNIYMENNVLKELLENLTC